MPNGIIHHKYYMRGYLVEVPLSILLSVADFKFGLGNFVGYSLGRWIDPDWDLTTATESDGRAMRELPIIGNFLFGISSTYSSFFRKRHRSFWTHFPIVSTIIRLAFVGIVPLIFLDSWGINLIGNGWHKFWLGVWAGLSQADAIHWYLDKTH